MIPLVVTLAIVAPSPNPQSAELLKTFRSELIAVTPGQRQFPQRFVMGRDDPGKAHRPAHQVSFDRKFHVARYEVPQNLWEAVMGSNPSRWTGPRNAVEMVSYHDAVTFCAKLTALLRSADLIGENQIVRLPTEAEWEYCARAGTITSYSFGDDPEHLDDYAWYAGNAAGNDPPVGAKKPNPWGLYDVHGYVWEWCADDWHDNYEGAPNDGSAWADRADGARAVIRGGSWRDAAERLTSRSRAAAPKGSRSDHLGLRCVLADAPHSEP